MLIVCNFFLADAHGPSHLTECFTKHAPLRTSIKCESVQNLSGMLKFFLPCDSSGILKNQNLSSFEKQLKTSSKMHYQTHGDEKHENGSTTKKENEPSTSQASGNVRGSCLNLSGAGMSSGNGGSSGDGGDDEDKSNQKKIPQDAPDLIPDMEEEKAEEKSSTTEITDMLTNFSLDEKPPSKPYYSPMDVSPAFAAAFIVEKRMPDGTEFDYAFSEGQQSFSPDRCYNVFAAALPQDEQEQVGTRVVQSDMHMSVDDDNDHKDDDDNASYFSDTTSESQVALMLFTYFTACS